MARADAGPVVAMEIFVEHHEIAPVRIVLELRRVRRTPDAGRSASAQEDMRQPPRDLGRHFATGRLSARSGRALHLEVVAENSSETSAATRSADSSPETRPVRASSNCPRTSRCWIPPVHSPRDSPCPSTENDIGMVFVIAREARECHRATGIPLRPACTAARDFSRSRFTSDRNRRTLSVV